MTSTRCRWVGCSGITGKGRAGRPATPGRSAGVIVACVLHPEHKDNTEALRRAPRLARAARQLPSSCPTRTPVPPRPRPLPTVARPHRPDAPAARRRPHPVDDLQRAATDALGRLGVTVTGGTRTNPSPLTGQDLLAVPPTTGATSRQRSTGPPPRGRPGRSCRHPRVARWCASSGCCCASTRRRSPS